MDPHDRPASAGRRRAAIATAGAVAALAGLAAGAYLLDGPIGTSWQWAFGPGAPGTAAQGERLYAQHCASCHGDRLQGQPDWQARKSDGKLPAPPHDATGHTWHHSDQQLFQLTKFGLKHIAPLGYVSDMPAYEGVLSDAQIRAVLGFIKESWPPEIRERQARLGRRP
jgi:mono/diheme cytochrome c family protein